jgi:hypothetical protein
MIRKRNLRNKVSSRNSNRRLYESIMKNVAKTVKKRLIQENFSETPHEPYTSNLNIELYLENNLFGAYISDDYDSGYDCSGKTPEEVGEQVKQYIIDMFYKDSDEY